MSKSKITQTNSGKQLTRRDFLKASGAVIASTFFFSTMAAACATNKSTTTTTSISSPATTSSLSLSTTINKPSKPKYGGTLRMMGIQSPGFSIGWMPGNPAQGGAVEEFLQPCFDPLLRGDNKGNYIGWLAETYKVTDDYKSVIFNLRKGVNFHDGSPFNAEVAKWNLDNIIAAKLVSDWNSVEIIDDYTLKVNIAGSYSNSTLINFSDSDKTWMTSKTAYDRNGEEYMKMHPVGTGPFKFVSYSPDVVIKFTRNTSYWKKDAQGNQLPYLDGIETIFVADPVTQKMEIESGAADLTEMSNTNSLNEMKRVGKNINVFTVAATGLIPDTANTDSPWANPKVREAAEYALDREGIAKIFQGYLEPMYQIPPPGNAAYDTNFPLARKYDPEKAKQLLDEAGFTGNPRFNTSIIVFPFLLKDVPSVVQDKLATVGIKVDLVFPDMGQFMQYQFGTWHNAVLITGPPVYTNMNQALSFAFLPADMTYKSWLRTPDFTQALNATLSSPTMDVNLIRAVTDMLVKEDTFIPVVYGIQAYVSSPFVVFNPGQRSIATMLNLEEVWLNK